MKILFQDDLDQLKKVRRIVNTMEEAEKLAVCLNQWSDDDSWGGTFRYNEIIIHSTYVNCRELARNYKGGGHKNRAGFKYDKIFINKNEFSDEFIRNIKNNIQKFKIN